MTICRFEVAMGLRRLWLMLALSAVFVMSCAPAWGWDQMAEAVPAEAPAAPAEVSKPEVVRLETVQARIKAVEADESLEQEARDKLVTLYKDVLAELESAAKWIAKRGPLEEALHSAATRVEAIKAELAKAASEPTLGLGEEATLAQWEQALTQAKAEADTAQKASADWEAKLRRRAERRVELPKLLADGKQRLKEFEQQVGIPATDGTTELSRAMRMHDEARRESLSQEVVTLEKEIAGFDATAAVWPLERDLAARNVVQAEKLVSLLQDRVNQHRNQEAAQQADRARAEAAKAHPQVRQLAEQNSELAKERADLATEMEQVSGNLATVNQRLERTNEEFERLTAKVDAAGLNNSIGSLLRRQRNDLQDMDPTWLSRQSRQNTIADIQLRLYDLEDERFGYGDIESRLAETLEAGGIGNVAMERWFLESEMRQLLTSRREFLDALISDYDRYLSQLVDLDTCEQELVDAVEEYSSYIDERVLWIKSATRVGWADVPKVGEAMRWLGDGQHWRDVGDTLWADAQENAALTALLGLLFGVLLAVQYRVRKQIRDLSQIAARNWNDQFAPTVRVLLLTGFLTLLRPALVWWVGWRLEAGAAGNDVVQAVGAALQMTSMGYLMLELVRQICRRHGLAEAHFNWPASGLRYLRRQMPWLAGMAIPCVFVIALLETHGSEPRKDSLGRWAFVGGMLCLSIFLHRALRPTGVLLAETLARHRGGWLERLRPLWYPLALGAPLTIAALAAWGYYYTALQLTERMFATAWLLVGVLLVHAMLQRWLLIARRRLAMKQARERRAASQSENDEVMLAPVLDEGLDLSTMNLQTRRLLRTFAGAAALVMLWGIWVDVLPALRRFDQVAMWTTTAEVMEESADDEGNAEVRMVTRYAQVTVADVMLALVILGLTLGAAKNLPGLLEFTILQRLPLEPSVRYAVTTISRYAISLVGVVLGFEAIGVGWSKVQWLVAAITVGLGFGLQEIFANFVSGLIILFERPVRVGDTVTVASTSGTVTRIRMRATTITDWDRKELIVPNKEFITGHLVNWTLTDPIVRMVLRVGIAYGSDTDLARALLLRVAKANPMVLENPAPAAVFTGFGDGSLEFELRVFVPSLECFLNLRHELNTSIDREFRAEGIEIAYPQRDLNIRATFQNAQILQTALTEVSPVSPVAQEPAHATLQGPHVRMRAAAQDAEKRRS
jgi:potassium efflux system protein